MKLHHCVIAFFVFTFLNGFSQNPYDISTIPEDLLENANAVVRSNNVSILIESSNEMRISKKRIVTILNKKGNKHIDAYAHYDKNIKIKELEVLVFDASGNQINRIKEKDFKDVSAVDGGTLYSDSRVKYLEYTPIDYPYTVEFIYEVLDENTAFIQPFTPVEDYYVSVEKSTFSIAYPQAIHVRTKEKNFSDFNLKKEEKIGLKTYELNNIVAFETEKYSPAFFDIAPKILIGLSQFSLEGVNTHVEDWNEFGKWMYHDLIKETHDLSVSTKTKIKKLVENETDDIAKAKIIYQFVQDKTRYISVQVGIGGWQPFNASKVDALGYGDCKALTNYTMALLNEVGVNSNYTVVYAGKSQRSLENDFAAMQGNHVILNIPNAKENIWLECTSQKLPFGFIGDFTDDRDVLVITPDGGKIEHTKKYSFDESLQVIKGACSVSNTGGVKATVYVNSKGIQYDDKYWLETETERDLDKLYKNRWKYINSVTINDIDIKNNKNDIEFVEDISFKANNYAKIIGERMLFAVNVLNRNTHVPDRYRHRKLALKVNRGFKDVDDVEVKLPEGFKVEALPKDINLETKFGSYNSSIEVKDDKTLVYHRTFYVNDGLFPKEDYNAFRDFYKTVARHDNAKIALIKN